MRAESTAAATPNRGRQHDALSDEAGQVGAQSVPVTHVDLIAYNPLGGEDSRMLLKRTQPDDPTIGDQVRSGWATYFYMSEPHSLADCPFGESAAVYAPGIATGRNNAALMAELAKVGADICGYHYTVEGWIKGACDCKWLGPWGSAAGPNSEQTGCAEIRAAYKVLAEL